MHQTAKNIVPILHNKAETSTGYLKKKIMALFMDGVQLPQVINIFGRDYSNLNNPILSKDINLQYIYKVYCREYGQHLMQQKEGLF